MNEDHLDPDKHLYGDDDGIGSLFEDVLSVLREHDTGRWAYADIHCCLTGKDADLDTHGQQGLQLLKVADAGDTYTATLRLHCGVTVPGTDVSLNVPDGISDAEYEERREHYLDIAQEAVCGFGASGDWSGDDWYLHSEQDFVVPIPLDDRDNVERDVLWARIADAYAKEVADWDRECEFMQDSLNEAAGWSKEDK